MGERLHELLQGIAQLLGELGDLLVGGVVLQRLLEGVLGGAQLLGSQRPVAVLEAERDRPQVVDYPAEIVVAPRLDQPVVGGPQQQVVAEVRHAGVGRRRQRVETVSDVRRGVRVERQLRPLLDHGARQLVGELAGGERHLDRGAAPFLSRLVAGDERQLDLCPRPGVGGEVARRVTIAFARAQLR